MHAALQVLSDSWHALQASGILANVKISRNSKDQASTAGMQANVPDHISPSREAMQL